MRRLTPQLLRRVPFLFTALLLITAWSTSAFAQNVNVTATAGTLAATYPTLKGAFDAINAGTHQGDIIAEVAVSTVEGATPATLNSSGAGSALYTSVLVRPSADGVSVSGNPALGFGVIQLKGSDNVTIDGDNPNTGGINRNLTIANTAIATTTLNAAIRVATVAVANASSADNITIKNCILNGSATGRNNAAATSTTASENNTFGIYVGGNGGATATDAPTALSSVTANTTPAATTVNSFVVDNNTVNQCARGIVFNGSSTATSTGVTITNNLVGDQATNNVGGVPPYVAPITTVYTKGILVLGTAAVTITGNTVKNLISYVGTAMNAIELTSSIGASVNINNNTVTTVAQNVAGNAVRAIIISAAAGPTTNVNGNTLTNLQQVGGSSVGGIDVTYSGTTTGSISKNSITTVRNRNAGGFGASGIRISGGSGWSINDNGIAEVLNVGTASFSGTFNCVGIKLASGSNHKVYHNSVNLFGASTSTGTNSIACLEISASSQTGIDIRNNLFSNKVTGGFASEAIVDLFTPFANVAMTLTQNNNAYFSTVGAQQGIAFAGATSFAAANLYTAANFNPAVNTPANNYRSVSTVLGPATNDNVSFASTAAAPLTSNTDLHIPAATSTQLESGGATVGIATDFDGQAFGSLGSATAPDIGFDEFAGIAVDLTAPAISYTALTNTTSTSNRSFTPVTVTDASGVDGSLGTRPRVYYKRSGNANTFVGNTSADNGWKYVEASGSSSPFSFTIDYTLLDGPPVAINDVIQYFVVAQDLAAPPNVGINSGTFNTQPSSVNLAAGNFPIGGSIRSYVIVDVPLNGDYTVGVTLFNQVTGRHVTFQQKTVKVMVETLEPEAQTPATGDKTQVEAPAADQLKWNKVTREVDQIVWEPMENGQKYQGALFVKRTDVPSLPPEVNAGVYATITAAVNDLNLRGVSGPVRFLLIDGSYPSETFPITINVTSADVPTAANPVTIKPNTSIVTNVTGSLANTALFKIFNTNYITIDGSNVVNGTSRDLTIENTNATFPNVVWFGSNGTTPVTNGALKNTIIKNGSQASSAVVIGDGATIGNAGYFSNIEVRNNRIEKAFVGVFGRAVAGQGSNLTYASNDLTASAASAIRIVGLYAEGVNGTTVTQNSIANFESATGENDVGIWLASGTSNSTVSQNTISNLNFTLTSGFNPTGINITPAAAAANILVARNSVSNFTSSGAASNLSAITVGAAPSGGVTIEKNNIQNINNTAPDTWNAMGINLNAGDNNIVRNNFIAGLSNSQTAGTGAFTPSFGVSGIRVFLGNGHRIYDNSVHLFGAQAGATNTNLVAALSVAATTQTGIDIRNNILSNQKTGGNATGTRFVDINLPTGGTATMNLTNNNNAYFEGTSPQSRMAVVGTTFGSGDFAAANFNPASTSPATNFRSYSSTLSGAGTNDNASFATTTAPPFVSNTDLHISTATLSQVSNAGVTVAGVTDDIDDQPRSATPDIGADEFSYPAPTVAVTSDVNPSNCGDKVNLTATLTPASGPTGSVQFFDGANPLDGPVTVVNGVATLSWVFSSTGSHSITAVYSGDSNYPGNTSPAYGQTVNPITTTTSLTSDVNPSNCGQKVNLTATVAPAAASGTVDFYDGTNLIGSGSLSGGVATLSVTNFAVGSHSLTAVYGGGGCYAGSTSPIYTQTVNAIATTTDLTSDVNPSNCGQKVNLTASVTPPDATGSVEFFDGATSLGTAPVVGGLATLSVSTFTVGPHSLTATYSGDACHTGSTSAPYIQTVNPIVTTTSLTSDVNPSNCGSKVNLTATVNPPTASGTVEFFDGATSLGTSPVAGGIATLSVTTFAVGPHSLTATYSGDACNTGSTSAPYIQTVNPIATTTTVATDVNPSPFENKVMITATVVPNDATGTVDFYDGATLIGSAPVVGGVATLSHFFTTEGKHVLSAVYNGDACHTASTSAPYSQMVDQPVAVLLSLFEANTVNDGVELRWQFSDAADLSTSWIERSPNAAGPWTRVEMPVVVEDGITVGIDREVEANKLYNYRLVASLLSGGTQVFSPVEGRSGSLVSVFALAKISPTPTKVMATIEYTVAKESKVRISIVDLQGRTVADVVNGVKAAGRYQAQWNRRNGGTVVPSGVYFVRYQAGGKVTTKRMVLE